MEIASITGILLLVIYLIPSIVAHGKKNWMAIIILNILLGWTFIGWVVALVWASCKDASPSYSDQIRSEVWNKNNRR